MHLGNDEYEKIMTFLYRITHHCMKTYEIEEVQLHALSLALGGGAWTVSRLRYFTSGKREK
jgi:hypothetical protein